MIGHQRDILATLGIDVWIPKAELCQPHQNHLWRDQSAPELSTEIILPQIQLRVSEPVIAPKESVKQPIDGIAVNKSVVTVQPAIDLSEQVVQPVQVDAFSLQILNLDQCCILIDATQMTEEQQRLWMNIQRAVSCEFSELNWPFPWINVQDGRGVGSYVQGFVDVQGTDKNILILGEVPHLIHPKMIQLASLQEMLDQPILKKRLWQFMQPRMVAVE